MNIFAQIFKLPDSLSEMFVYYSFKHFNTYPVGTESEWPLARPVCTSLQSGQALQCWLTNFKFSLDIPDIFSRQVHNLERMDYSI